MTSYAMRFLWADADRADGLEEDWDLGLVNFGEDRPRDTEETNPIVILDATTMDEALIEARQFWAGWQGAAADGFAVFGDDGARRVFYRDLKGEGLEETLPTRAAEPP